MCYLSALIKRLSVIGGYKSTISNVRKDFFLGGKLLIHRMTSFVLLHWLTPALHLIDIFILSTMYLLTLPISGFVGLIRWHLVLLAKFSLWFFIVINAVFHLVLVK